MICSDCKKSHDNQRAAFPKGADVLAIANIAEHKGFVRCGTFGKVTAHTDDGRAVVQFKGRGVHTFHYADTWIVRCYPNT